MIGPITQSSGLLTENAERNTNFSPHYWCRVGKGRIMQKTGEKE